MNQKMAKRIFDYYDLNYIIFPDGNEIVEQVTKSIKNLQIINVVLLDMQMVNLNGDLACKKIRKLGYKGYVGLVSGNSYENNDLIQIKKDFGFDVILSKLGKIGIKDLCKELSVL